MKYSTNKKHKKLYKALENKIKNSEVAYQGPIENNIFLAIDKYSKLLKEKYPDASRKLYKIFIELTQNIVYYSAEKFVSANNVKIGCGAIYIYNTKAHIVLTTANPVYNTEIDVLTEKIDYINSLDRTALREYKRKQRRKPSSIKGNANIGLIQTTLTAANPLKFETHRIDDNDTFFILNVYINKE